MNKKLLLTIIIMVLLLAGCSIVNPTNQPQQDGQSTSSTMNGEGSKSQEISQGTAESETTITANDAIDYNQYLKKAWVMSDNPCELFIGLPSFRISKIVDGEITGNFDLGEAITGFNDNGHLTGTVNKDTAECQFDDGNGCKGNIKLVFKTKDVIEATINYTDTLKEDKERLKDGTYQFRPYKLKDYKGLIPIESQSFMINSNVWGNVKFVSGGSKKNGESKTVSLYLIDKDENILYHFNTDSTIPVDVKAVSFQDVNNDGLKDIIIIVIKKFGKGPAAIVYFQKNDGLFICDSKLDQEINHSGNNRDIKTVTDYLSKKF